MLRLRSTALLVLLAPACTLGGDEPHVSALTPSSGPYGTTVVIHGEHLDKVTLDVAGLGAVEPENRSASSISFRFLFPAEGPVAIVDRDGRHTPAGEFLGAWRPSNRIARGRPLAVASRGRDVVVLTASSVAIFDDAGGAREIPVPDMPVATDAVGEAVGDHVVFLLRDDKAVYSVEVAVDAAAVKRVGDLPKAAPVEALGLDANGAPALVARANGRYYRFHATSSGFSPEPDALDLTDPRGLAFTSGGDLLVVTGRDDTPAFGDHVGVVSLARIPAGERSGPSSEIARINDAIESIRVTRPVDTTAVIDACGVDTDPFERSRLRCTTFAAEGSRVANLGSGSAYLQSSPPPRTGSLRGSTVASTACADGKLTLVESPVLASARELPVGTMIVEPCADAGLVIVGADGRGRVLLEHQGGLYLVRPRS